MKALLFALILAILPLSFVFADDMYPDIAIVNTDADGLMGVIEKSAAQLFYMNHSDIYDFLFIYTTFTPSMNMQQGIPIQYTVKGINREDPFTGYGSPADWGSAGKLLGAARMCNIDQYPEDPDAAISTGIVSPYAGMSTIELQAHEWSHYWLSAMDFKKEGMSKNHSGLRGCEGTSGPNGTCLPNQHWNSYFMSGPSVMYGGDITDNEDSTFTFYFGNPKKYGPLDKYVMGFIPPEEVGDLFFLCKSENIEECREGSAAVPPPKYTEPSTKTGLFKHIVTMDDVIRAMGPRIPSSAESQKHFNVAFIIANKNGFYPFPQQLQKLENIRVRFQEWFTWATDGKATICTELDGDCENSETPDDDDPVIDEDTVIADNTVIPDEEVTPDESVTDNTVTPDETTSQDEQTVQDNNTETPDNSTEQPVDEEEVGCGCTIVF